MISVVMADATTRVAPGDKIAHAMILRWMNLAKDNRLVHCVNRGIVTAIPEIALGPLTKITLGSLTNR